MSSNSSNSSSPSASSFTSSPTVSTYIGSCIAVEIAIIYFISITATATSKQKRFNTVAYTFFVSTGVLDILSIICTMIMNLQIYGILEMNSWYIEALIQTCSTMTSVAEVGHILGNLTVTISGFSAVVIMRGYDKIWRKENQRKLIALQYLIAFGTHFHRFILIVRWDDTIQRYVAIPILYTQLTKLITRVYYFALYISYICIGLVLNCYTLYKLQNIGIRTKAQTIIVLFSCLCFATSLPCALYNILNLVTIITNNQRMLFWLWSQYTLASYLMLLPNPISMLVLSADLRSRVFCIRKQDVMDLPSVRRTTTFSISTRNFT